MTTVFGWLGVDFVQWRAVTRALLRTDFRLPLTEGGSSLGKVAGFLTTALVLSLFGLGAAVLVLLGRDVLLTGTITLLYLSVMLTTTLLTQHGLTMLTADDYVILGPRPVSSRTFLAIRVTNVLFHTLLVTTLMAYPVVLAYLLGGGVHVPRAVASIAAIYGWSIALALALVVSYSTLLGLFGARRFKRAVGYLQLAGGFMAYGGLLLAGRHLSGSGVIDASIPDAWWVLALPPAWFASYLELAVGQTNSTTVLRMTASLVTLVGLGALLRGKLGLDYARHLSEITIDSAPQSPRTRTPFFTAREGRAAAILVLAHFRHDLRVRLGILAIVPLIVFYIFIGEVEGGFDLVALAVLLFPAVLTRHFASSETHQASWIYFATPADRQRLVVAAKNVAVMYFVVPFLMLVAAVFAWRTGRLDHAIVHTVILGLISHVALQGSIVLSPRLPFSMPPDKTSGSAMLMGWMVFVILGGQAALWALDRWVYVSRPLTAGTIAGLLVVSWAMNHAIAWRVGHSQLTR